MDSFHIVCDRLSVTRVSKWKSHTQRLGQEGKGTMHRKALSVLSRVLRKQPIQADTSPPRNSWSWLQRWEHLLGGGSLGNIRLRDIFLCRKLRSLYKFWSEEQEDRDGEAGNNSKLILQKPKNNV